MLYSGLQLAKRVLLFFIVACFVVWLFKDAQAFGKIGTLISWIASVVMAGSDWLNKLTDKL